MSDTSAQLGGVRRKGLPWLTHFREALFRVTRTSPGSSWCHLPKWVWQRCQSHFHSIRASPVSTTPVPAHGWDVEPSSLSRPWCCSGQGGRGELAGLFCSPFRGQNWAHRLDKKLHVHVMLPHPAQGILRTLFTNTDEVLGQARLLATCAR